MSKTTAIIVALADAALAISGLVLWASDGLTTILIGDGLFALACVGVIPLLHYWIEGRP